MGRRTYQPLVLALAVTALAVATAAQSVTSAAAASQRRVPGLTVRNTASVQGMVQTPDGNGILAASVVLSDARGRDYGLLADADGIFRAANLLPGTYSIRATAIGYDRFRKDGVVLDAGEVLTIEIRLNPNGERAAAQHDRQISIGPGGEDAAPGEPAYREISRRKPAEEVSAEDVAPENRVMSPSPNRWRELEVRWQRHPGRDGDFPYVDGHWWDPFNRNVLKGDKPVFGKYFLNFTGTSTTAVDVRRLYVPAVPSGARPASSPFYGDGAQQFLSQTFRMSFDINRGDTVFRPVDWRLRITPAVNLTQLWTRERGIVNVDVRHGTDRTDWHVGLQEAFVEAKLRDLSPNFDFVSIRAGIQAFNSDFRGFIFSSEQPGVRVFGNLRSNRIQYNLAHFVLLEKDTNSGLNTLHWRKQQVAVANIYIQDFFAKGYTASFSYHFNRDDASVHYDENGFLVRPAPIGLVQPHDIRAHYIGWTGTGHLGRYNVNHAFYQVLGFDERNPVAGRRTDINAQLAAVELSMDKDWLRPRVAFFWASGDRNPRDGHARGFDSIAEAQSFAGGIFSFFNREGIRLTGTGVGLIAPESFLPNLRSSKEEGQANYVNPGLFLWNAGLDMELTPSLKAVLNASYMRFHHTEPLELLLFQSGIRSSIGTDYSIGFVHRPPLSDNMTITWALSALTPGSGLRQIYTSKTLFSGIVVVRFVF